MTQNPRFETLVRDHMQLVTSVALAVVRDVPTSEDVAQDVFVTLWRRLDDIRDPASIPAWLRQVTRNRAIDRLRARARGPVEDPASDVDPSIDPETELARHEEEQAVFRCLDQLPDDARECLILYYREGHDVKQVASLLEMSPAAVRKRMSRARELLRSDVEERLSTTLRRTAPTTAFVALVLAALPGSAQASPTRTWPIAATAVVGGASIAALLLWTSAPETSPEATTPEVAVAVAAPTLSPSPAPDPTPSASPDQDPDTWPPVPTSPFQEALFAYVRAAGFHVASCPVDDVPAEVLPHTRATLDDGQLWAEVERSGGAILFYDVETDEELGQIPIRDAVAGVPPRCGPFEPPLDEEPDFDEEPLMVEIYGETLAFDEAMIEAWAAHTVMYGMGPSIDAAERRLEAAEVALTYGLSPEARVLAEERRDGMARALEGIQDMGEEELPEVSEADLQVIEVMEEAWRDKAITESGEP